MVQFVIARLSKTLTFLSYNRPNLSSYEREIKAVPSMIISFICGCVDFHIYNADFRWNWAGTA